MSITSVIILPGYSLLYMHALEKWEINTVILKGIQSNPRVPCSTSMKLAVYRRELVATRDTGARNSACEVLSKMQARNKI